MSPIRTLSICATLILAFAGVSKITAQQATFTDAKRNLSHMATASTSSRYGSFAVMNDDLTPTDTLPWRQPRNRGRQRPATAQWVQYDWVQPIGTKEISVFLWDYKGGLPLPKAYRIQYWNGSAYVPVNNPKGLGVVNK